MAADSTIAAKIQHLDGGDRLCVASGGTIEVATGGSLKVGTIAIPALPTDDGDYVLHIASNVATWVAAT